MNLRFCVRRHLMGDEVHRGVVFVREFVPRSAVVVYPPHRLTCGVDRIGRA